MPPSTDRMKTRSACSRNVRAKATVLAVSVLAFQAIITVCPNRFGAVGGATRTGRAPPQTGPSPALMRGRGAAAVEKCRFQRAHARRRGAAGRLAQHGDVEQPGMLTDEVVTRRRFYPE